MTEVQENVTRTPAPPIVAGDEATTLLQGVERARALVGWKCGGLDAAGLRATVGVSSITLGGLLKHLAHVEDDMVDRWFIGQELPAPWSEIDWDENPDWDWTSAADDSPAELEAMWRNAVERSRKVFGEALEKGGLEQRGAIKNRAGESPTLRYIFMTLIEEYARHAGHADLIRESVDGLVGEDPPY